MSFSEMGFEGEDLSGVEVRGGQSILGAGRHVVNINSAEVEKDEKKKTIQLVLGYENDDGVIRQWIYKYHDGSEAATRIGLEQIVSCLRVSDTTQRRRRTPRTLWVKRWASSQRTKFIMTRKRPK